MTPDDFASMGRIARAEIIRLIHRPAWIIAWLYGAMASAAQGVTSSVVLGSRQETAPGRLMSFALGGPFLHASLLSILTWVSLPIAYLVAMGSPVGENPPWLRYLVSRQKQRIDVWVAITCVRVCAAALFGSMIIASSVITIYCTIGASALQDVPWRWVIVGTLGMIWWADACLVALFRVPMALGLVLLTNYGSMASISFGMLSWPFLAPATGMILAMSVTHHHWGELLSILIASMALGYSIGYSQFRSSHL